VKNDYREQQLRELLEISRRGDVKLTVPQIASLLSWDGTSTDDARRLTATVATVQRS
jgi:hypothetical protein